MSTNNTEMCNNAMVYKVLTNNNEIRENDMKPF